MNNRTIKFLTILISLVMLFALCACGHTANTKTADRPEAGNDPAAETAENSTDGAKPNENDPVEGSEEPVEYIDRLNIYDPTIKMDVDAFKQKAKKLGFEVPFFSNAILLGIDDSTVVYKTDHTLRLWQAEYYICTSMENAKDMFDVYAGDVGTNIETKPDGTVSFEITEEGKYTYVAYYGRSLLYITADEQYISQVKEFVQAINF